MVTAYSDLHVRLDSRLKKRAEEILEEYGISPSGAINIFYRQVVAHEGLPFRMARKAGALLDYDLLTDEEANAVFNNAEEEIKRGAFQPVDDAFSEIMGSRHEEI